MLPIFPCPFPPLLVLTFSMKPLFQKIIDAKFVCTICQGTLQLPIQLKWSGFL